MAVSRLLNDLNDPQHQAVTSLSQHLLVLAGAGSGKTRVLAHRIAWLIETTQISPWSIIAVTFTNKTAREMRGRIETLLHLDTQSMWIGTFHSLSHRLLRRHWQEAGLSQQFQILDNEDQLGLLKRICKQLQLDENLWPVRQFQNFINNSKDAGLQPQDIDVQGSDQLANQVQVYQAYQTACERGALVDFGELLLRSHKLWLQRPDILQHYQNRFQHLLVDEFQDTNTIQYAWLRTLAGSSCSVTVVGDDDQSIYSWRGARIENIQQFSQDFKHGEIIRLEQNYRSTETILKAANGLIKHNNGRLGKSLWTEDQSGEPISIYAGFNEQDEARFIVEQIHRWESAGNLRSEAAILYRSNAQSRVLEEALIRSGKPYRIYGGQRFYDRLEIRNALAYMRLVNNRYDDAAIERIINIPTRGIGARTLDVIRQNARTEGSSLWQAAQGIIISSALPARAHNALHGFLNLIEQMATATAQMQLDELTDYIIRVSGLIKHHSKEKGEKAQTRIENLNELVSAAKTFSSTWNPAQLNRQLDEEADERPETALAAMLDQAALDSGEQQADESEDSVQLMTLHSAKGLEFPLVFMAGLEEGLFPHQLSLVADGRLEEERRLCYVGITRAMQKLIITYAEARRLHGQDTMNRPSRFISELPQELIEEVRLKSSVRRPLSYRPEVSNPTDRWSQRTNLMETPVLALGQSVRHAMFGEGTVIDAEGSGPRARVQVQFDSQGSKWLVLSHAKLELI
jgi:DNA helicase II / ATP-dependent DNA helicase PcrA